MTDMTQRTDELALWNGFGNGSLHKTPRDAGIALGIPNKRVNYLCLKWAQQGRYEYGICVDLGWKNKPCE